MFSFFKRLIGKSTDTPEENKTEDVADSGSEGAEALRHPTTPVMPVQPVETGLQGGEAAVRTSETQARGADVGAGAGAPVQSNGHVSAAEPAAAAAAAANNIDPSQLTAELNALTASLVPSAITADLSTLLASLEPAAISADLSALAANFAATLPADFASMVPGLF